MSPHRNGQHQRLWGECSPCTSRESPRCDLCRERLVGARRHHEAEAAQHQCWAAPGQAARAPHQTSLSLSPHCGCDGEGCCVPGHRRDAGQGTLVLEQPWAERGQSRLPFAPHPGLAPPWGPFQQGVWACMQARDKQLSPKTYRCFAPSVQLHSLPCLLQNYV